ncbi:hypothetical protein SYNTR_0739 [Candidatus Syntrophocurvum alkaliphilum]|uniref:HTH lysR-type domain-containing protein n=1 Tax=Candidatus Syntrophocurvum alkaliphilum TaxID=2293317 RepID=A0A6I6DE68_9FIRM|nr:LysR family transcriptional regulator [Candidatus Syntrophocurvum alkaliphilum]QGT99332.1 hypothetical protein SYNTR_0739 [Candidatus Syntrophocurvum alkaliphilum]
MNIEQFEVFRTIAQTKSFTKAANILNFTQPAISSQIKLLEKKFNVSLFERTNNGVRLTEAGKKFYDYGDRILTLYTQMENDISKLSGQQNRECIKVGASYTAGNYYLPSSIINYKERNPNINIRLEISNIDDIIEKVRNRIIDLGVIEGEIEGADLNKSKIKSIKLVLIAPPTGKWLDINSITVDELRKEPFIAREEESSFRQFISNYLTSKGINIDKFNILTEITSFEAIKYAVMDHKGVAIVPSPVVEKELREGYLKQIKVEDLYLYWDMNIIYRANESLIGYKEDFINYISEPQQPSTLKETENEEIRNQRLRFI